MKNKLYLTFTILIGFYLKIYAQDLQGQRLYSGDIQNISFFQYPIGVQIKAILQSESQAKCIFSEDLMLSVMSCTDATWEAYHTLGGLENAEIKSTEHYGFIKTMNKDKNYFELKHKFEFKIANVPTAIIKFYLITEQSPLPQAGVLTMQKIDGRWQKCSMKMFSKMAMLALRLRSDKLQKIIDGSDEDSYLKEIKGRIQTNGKLDFDKLSAEIDSWYMADTKANKAKKEYFKDPNSFL